MRVGVSVITEDRGTGSRNRGRSISRSPGEGPQELTTIGSLEISRARGGEVGEEGEGWGSAEIITVQLKDVRRTISTNEASVADGGVLDGIESIVRPGVSVLGLEIADGGLRIDVGA